MKSLLKDKKVTKKIMEAIGWSNYVQFYIEVYMEGYTHALIIGLPSEMPKGKSIVEMLKED